MQLNGDDDSDSVEEGVETSVEEEEKYEVSQFHSEDENGRIVFGFHSPDQIRMEARDADGSVRGSYSYIDPNGNVVKVSYFYTFFFYFNFKNINFISLKEEKIISRKLILHFFLEEFIKKKKFLR